MKSLLTAATLFLALNSFSATAPTYKELRAKAFAENQEMSVRWKALMDMTRMKKNESIVDLKKALGSNTWFMRNAALVAIQSFNPDMAYEIAKKQLNDPALVVRSAAVDILTKNKKNVAEVRELLWKEMNSAKNRVKAKSLWIRPQIGQFLATDPQNSEREKFLSLADEKDDEIRTIASLALLKLQAK